MLPDASSGQNPGTLAASLSRCKEGMASVFAVRVHTFQGLQVSPKLIDAVNLSPGTELVLGIAARSWF